MPLVPHSPAGAAEEHGDLIVALDAGDLAGADRARAEALAASCAGCAALVDDLAAIRGTLTALPAPERRRDYRLTPEDAARLRPTGWRRALDWLGAPRSSVRPLATGLTALGIAGLLLTAGLPGLGSSASLSTSGAAPVANDSAAQAPAEAGGTAGPAGAPSLASPAVPVAAPSAAAAPPQPAATSRPGVAPPFVAGSSPVPAASAPPYNVTTTAPPPPGGGVPGAAASPGQATPGAAKTDKGPVGSPAAGGDRTGIIAPGIPPHATASAATPTAPGAPALVSVAGLSVLLLVAGIGLFVARLVAVRHRRA